MIVKAISQSFEDSLFRLLGTWIGLNTSHHKKYFNQLKILLIILIIRLLVPDKEMNVDTYNYTISQ